MSSENGWEPLHPTADQLEWVTVPGTTVRLQFLKGWASTILRAFAADFNAYIEPLRDADSAGYTATNSVATSNHLNGTAMDLNWNSHPFQVLNAGFDAAKIATARELLSFYEDTVFWGNDWNSPKDAMHWNMGYNTWNNPHVLDVINRKIRADGLSTFRRGGTVTPPPPPPPASNAADVLARATGVTLDKAQQILPTMQQGLALAECDNVNRIAMAEAQWGHESANFNATEEYASGAAYEGRADLGNTQPGDGVRFKGRTWIQITGRFNYGKFSQWAFGKGLVPTPTYFVDNPTELSDLKWAGVGAAWYWVVARPQINGLCDARNLTAVTQAINGGQNGATDRKTRYDRALALGDQLLALTTNAPSTPGDDMASVPQDQWDRVYRELTQKLPSRSPLRHLGEGAVDTMAGFVLNSDGSQHVEVCKLLAEYGHAPTIALLEEVANADPNLYPDRQADAEMAQAILAEATAPTKSAVAAVSAPVAVQSAPDNTRELADAYAQIAALQAENAQLKAAQFVAPVPAVIYTDTGTQGQAIGRAYDALESLRLADALPIESRAPLAALIGVLQTKNGSQL